MRQARLAVNKLTPIRDIWSMFIDQTRTLYNPTESLTIDEQLVNYRGRCNF